MEEGVPPAGGSQVRHLWDRRERLWPHSWLPGLRQLVTGQCVDPTPRSAVAHAGQPDRTVGFGRAVPRPPRPLHERTSGPTASVPAWTLPRGVCLRLQTRYQPPAVSAASPNWVGPSLGTRSQRPVHRILVRSNSGRCGRAGSQRRTGITLDMGHGDVGEASDAVRQIHDQPPGQSTRQGRDDDTVEVLLVN